VNILSDNPLLPGDDQASDHCHSNRRILILSESASWLAVRGPVEISPRLGILRASRTFAMRVEDRTTAFGQSGLRVIG